MIVVTGGTGHLGNALLRCLPAECTPGVRALVRAGRSSKSISALDLEVVEGDVRDYNSLVKAFRGAEIVYHLAGIVSIAGHGLKRLRETNVEGTRNVIDACRTAGVGRLVYTSSVHAFVEPPRGTSLTETAEIDPNQVRGPYARSKAEATLLVLDAVRQGLDAVVVYPSGIIGPHDFRPSDTGKLICDCARGRLKAYVRGAYDFVDARDVAQGLMAAAKSGRTGQGYILSGHQVAVEDLLDTVKLITGAPAPRWCLPFGFARAASHLMPAYYLACRQPPRFTTYSLDVVSSNCLMSYEKAEQELAFSARPFHETMRDTLDWFRQQGILHDAR
jgi:dihydroflavonol-4-reductase